VAAEEGERLLRAFGMALAKGDVEALARTLTGDAEFLSDGGGLVAAVPRPLRGADRIAKALLGFFRLADWSRTRFREVRVNGLHGWLLHDVDGTPIQTLALEPADDGRIGRIYVVRNPLKLQHLKPAGAGDG
jgi:RNA polymerase sigma-70 factor (ECF subfamily)